MCQQQNNNENILFVDESGDHAFRPPEHLRKQPVDRFLSLLGVWFEKTDYRDFEAKLNQFKREFFGDERVGLHREDIINKRGEFFSLSDPHVQKRFNAGLIGVIKNAHFHKWLVIIDKQSIPMHRRPRVNPYHNGLYLLLDRYSEWLSSFEETGTVVAETRGKAADNLLQQTYRDDYVKVKNLYAAKGQMFPITSETLQLEPKKSNVAGLQLADLLAHPYKQHCLIAQGWIPNSGSNFGTELSALLVEKFKNERQPYCSVASYPPVCLTCCEPHCPPDFFNCETVIRSASQTIIPG